MNCPYCGKAAVLQRGAIVQPRRRDRARRLYWHCAQCEAWAACAPGTRAAVGRIANRELRDLQQAARQEAWRIENGILMQRAITREEAKRRVADRLARHMRLPPAECDIGLFDAPQCREAIAFFAAGARP